MASFLKLEVLGNLIEKPELRKIKVRGEDREVIEGGIAVRQGDSTIFLTYEIWGKSAENAAKYLDKGSKVLVTDAEYLPLDPWIDKDGKPRAELKIRIKEWHWLDSKKDSKGEKQ